MRLKRARVMKYRSIRDSGWFDVELGKSILVGPNEAGKTVLLQALQQLNPPVGVRGFDPLRDYPRSEYNDITTGKVKPENITIVEAHFSLEDADKAAIPAEFKDVHYIVGRKLDNKHWHRIEGGPPKATYGAIEKDLTRLAAHVDSRGPRPAEGTAVPPLPSAQLAAITQGWTGTTEASGENAKKLNAWLKIALPLIDEGNQAEESRYDQLISAVGLAERLDLTLKTLWERRPVFVLFTNYFRVRPLIHLEHLAQRLETNVLAARV